MTPPSNYRDFQTAIIAPRFIMCAILLGIVTYDANLLILEPRRPSVRGKHGNGPRP